MEKIDHIILWLFFWIDSDLRNSILPYIEKGWHYLNNYSMLRFMGLVIIVYFTARIISRKTPQLIVKISNYFQWRLGNKFSLLVEPILFKLVFLAGLALIINASQLSETQNFIAIATIKSFIIVFILLFINAAIGLVLDDLSTSHDKQPAVIQPAIVPIFEYSTILIIVLLGIYFVFGAWNVEMTALLASAGIMGLAISMAAKDTLADIIAGILILTDAPFHLGDVIEVADEMGTIIQIGIRSIRIKTRANVELVIPNSKIGSSVIINKSFIVKDKLKIKVEINVAYGVDPDVIRTILLNVANAHERVLKEKIQVVLIDFNQVQTTFMLICFIDEGVLAPKVIPALREQIYLKFLQEKIELSSPTTEYIAISDFPNIFGSGAKPKDTGTLRKLPKFNTLKEF